MRIAIDAAGREPGLATILEGVLEAHGELKLAPEEFQPVLYGPGDELRRRIDELGAHACDCAIVDSPQAVEMDELPREALREKTRSSITSAVTDLAAGRVDGFVSMGNTGAVVGACRTILGKPRWVSKPAMAVPLPRKKGMGLLLDAGAVPDPKPAHMLQFAAMGAAFVEHLWGIREPRVGLLNIGTESHKGDERSRDCHKLLTRSPLNFIGNVEGGDLFTDRTDVVLTTGFVGNIVLKFSEAIPRMVLERLTGSEHAVVMGQYLADMDYRRYGGATLIGVNAPVVIGHGRSSARAVSRAIKWMLKMGQVDLTHKVQDMVFRTRKAIWLTNPFSRGEDFEES